MQMGVGVLEAAWGGSFLWRRAVLEHGRGRLRGQKCRYGQLLRTQRPAKLPGLQSEGPRSLSDKKLQVEAVAVWPCLNIKNELRRNELLLQEKYKWAIYDRIKIERKWT